MPLEQPNTLLSTSNLKFLDLLCDGPISGFVYKSTLYSGDPLMSTYYDDVVVRNIDGSYNYNVSGQGFDFDYTLGTAAQTGLIGYQKIETIIPLSSNTHISNPPLGTGPYKVVTTSFNTATYPDADAIKVTIRIPALYVYDQTNGNTNLFSVRYAVDISTNDGFFVQQGPEIEILGKCTTPYLKTSSFVLPKGNLINGIVSWKVRIRRTSTSILNSTTANDIYVDSIAIISSSSFAYPNSALVGTLIAADQFASIPSRSYEIAGLLMNVPSGYNPTSYSYTVAPSFERSVEVGGDVPRSKHIGMVLQAPPAAASGNMLGIDIGMSVTGVGIPSGSVIVDTHVGPNRPFDTNSSFFFTINNQPTADYTGAITFFPITPISLITPATYPSQWNGTFVSGKWTDNPAWIYYDLMTNPIHGLGDYIQPSYVDKWTLYQIAQYCDQMVDDGNGGLEPRFTCNVVINQPDEAYSVLLNLASVFRGMLYYANGTVHATQTSDKSPVYAYTNANVIDGVFSYSDTARTSRSTVAVVKWVDPQNSYRENVEYVEDTAGILRYGYVEKQATAFATTSQGQAYRLGSWLLQTEQLLTETVSFQTALEGLYIKPGDNFAIYDNFRNNQSQGGRVLNFSTGRDSILLDRPIKIDPGYTYTLSTIVPKFTLDGTGDVTGSSQIDLIRNSQIETLVVSNLPSTTDTITTLGGFSSGLYPGTPWILSASGSTGYFNEASFYTCLTVGEVEPGKFEILAVEANTGINFAISTGYVTAGNPPNPGDFKTIEAPQSITLSLATGMLWDNTFIRNALVGWQESPSENTSYYIISGKSFGGSYLSTTVNATGYTYPLSTTGLYLFSVAAVSEGGVISPYVTGGVTVPSTNPLGQTIPLSGVFISKNFDPLYLTSLSGYSTGFIGTQPEFTWDTKTAANGFETVETTFLSGFRLKCKSFDNSVDYLISPIILTGTNILSYQFPDSRFIYTGFSGGLPQRGFNFVVESIDFFGNVSTGASLKVNNTYPRKPLNSGFLGYNSGVSYTIQPNLENDVSGIYLWYNTTGGFVPNFFNYNYTNENLAGFAANNQTGNYNLWFSLIDTFGASGSPIYGPVQITQNDILPSVSASITQLAQTIATSGGALAQWLTLLSAQTTGQYANIQIGATAFVTGGFAGTGGIAIAGWGFKLDANGKVVSMQAIAATGAGIVGSYGKIVFGGADLESNTFTSSNGLTGWQITAAGDVTFNSAKVRGTFTGGSPANGVGINYAGLFAGNITGGTYAQIDTLGRVIGYVENPINRPNPWQVSSLGTTVNVVSASLSITGGLMNLYESAGGVGYISLDSTINQGQLIMGPSANIKINGDSGNIYCKGASGVNAGISFNGSPKFSFQYSGGNIYVATDGVIRGKMTLTP